MTLRLLFSLVKSDVNAAYPLGGRLVALKFFLSPPLRATTLVRLCQLSPHFLYWIFKNILLTLHGIDFSKGAEVGRGLKLPHPVNIVIGSGVKIKDYVTIYQGVTLGQIKNQYPVIETNSVIFPNSVICGALTIPKRSKVQALSLIICDDPRP